MDDPASGTRLGAPARRTPGRPKIPVERIVAEALAIVDTHGADALTLRGLAQRMNSGTATIYRHFSDRDALVAAVIDAVFAEHEFHDVATTPGGPWRAALTETAVAMFDVLRRHPGVASLLIGRMPDGPHARAFRERFLALLLAADFPPDIAVRSYATVARFVLGFGVQIDPGDQRFTGSTPDSDEDLPATRATADQAVISLDVEFRFGLDLMLDGLDHYLKSRS